MSKIDELIKKLCPNGVKYIKLNELLDYIQPTKYIVQNTKYKEEYDIPVLTAGQTFILGYTNEKQGVYNANKKNPVIIFDDFTASKHWVDFKFKVKSSAMKILINKTKNSIKYIFYCMQNIKYIPKEHARQWIQTYSEFKIPIPPLAVQREIVRVLDKFSELEAELEAELEERQQQYNYYSEKIFNEETNKIEIGRLLKDKGYIRGPFGSALVKKDMVKNGVPVYEQQHVIYNHRDFRYYITEEKAEKLNRFKVETNDLIISCSGTVGKVSVIKPTDNKGVINQALLILRVNMEKILPQYLKYYLESPIGYKSITANTNKSAQVNIANRNAIESIKIPLPSIPRQVKIIEILNNFEKLVNDISEGLPAEIQLRRKQYEYYRNKLLNFEELK